MESDVRFYRRRANEEIAAANRAVTDAARERRMRLAGIFLERLRASEADYLMTDSELSAFNWSERASVSA